VNNKQLNELLDVWFSDIREMVTASCEDEHEIGRAARQRVDDGRKTILAHVTTRIETSHAHARRWKYGAKMFWHLWHDCERAFELLTQEYNQLKSKLDNDK
jgi:hypothetical protein